jgi:ADP-heptose:LPS heptosyltransferase
MTTPKTRNISPDCRFFKGDRPCEWHKQEGNLCPCEKYVPLQKNLLMIKLDAMGDVLRTTCLLPAIEHKWPGVRVTWITRQESLPLLINNPYVAEVIPYGPESLLHLQVRVFDRVINLDAGKISSGLASLANSPQKTGYLLHQAGYVVGTNPEAENWLNMGVFDDLKKENNKTYQEIMCSIIGLDPRKMEYVLALDKTEEARARQVLTRLKVNPNKKIIGIHTGAGGRWQLKQWRQDGYEELIMWLSSQLGDHYQLLLLGGPTERDFNEAILSKLNGRVFNSGYDNDLRTFAGLVGCCSLILANDSLAMHIALALKCRVVTLFGPTSSSEIELFGLGEKLIPEMECLCCYKNDCDKKPNCMDLISVEMVKIAIKKQLTMIG